MLVGKTAVVTGGSRGIGRAICETFAQNRAQVAFLYAGSQEKAQELQRNLQQTGVKAVGYQCNVADAAEVHATFQAILAEFGQIDILVNNAGITKDKLLLGMREADFEQVLDTNLKGAFYTIKQVYPVFLKQKSGKIINISSVAGLTGNPGQANYAASKAGLIGLTKTVAKELASRGICCNAVAPGFVQTDMTRAFADNDQIKQSIPMQRMGLPEEVAELVLFLASNRADYITGEVIRIDGGLAM